MMSDDGRMDEVSFLVVKGVVIPCGQQGESMSESDKRDVRSRC